MENYLADLGFQAAGGLELFKTAVELAKQRASEQGLYLIQITVF